MNNVLFLVPKPGIVVRDPVTKLRLAEGGEEKSGDRSYWLNRLRDQSVTRGVPPVPPPTALQADAAQLARDTAAGAGADVVAADVARVQADAKPALAIVPPESTNGAHS